MSYVEDRIAEIQATPEPRKKHYEHVEHWKTRHGKFMYYYRLGKGTRIRLPNPAEVGDEVFRRAYEKARNGVASEKAKRGVAPAMGGDVGKPGYVYFLRNGRTVKIGFTTSIKSRIKSIQTSCAEAVEVLMVMPGTEGTEKFLHQRFTDNHIGGEWFSLTGLLAEFLNVKIPAMFYKEH
jgi:hypothetical protein